MAFSLANSWLIELREGSSRPNQDDRSSSNEAKDDEVSQLDLSESDIDETAVTDFELSDSEERMTTIEIDLVINEIPNL